MKKFLNPLSLFLFGIFVLASFGQAHRALNQAGLRHNVVIRGNAPVGENDLVDLTVKLKIQAGDSSQVCTGVFVDSDLVLTAGHCFKQLYPVPAGDGVTVTSNFGTFQSLEYEVHPDYVVNIITDGLVKARFAYNDLALIRLKKSASLNKPALLPERDFTIEGEQRFVIAGYGISEYQNTGSAGQLLMKEVKVQEYQDRAGVKSIYRLSQGHHCRGDSGGPLYLKTKDNELVVVGINTWGDCNTVSRAEILAHHIDWLESTAKALQSIQEI